MSRAAIAAAQSPLLWAIAQELAAATGSTPRKALRGARKLLSHALSELPERRRRPRLTRRPRVD